MRQALYRKYRPKTLSEVVGQEYLKVAIGNQLASGQIGHAYLFTGPKGTGKTTVARILARSVNCLDIKNGMPCGKCANCVAFDNGQMMDLIEIDAASNRSIDNIRELISKIALSPSQGRYKIYVIDEAHQLTKDASNALLKTLEEPPSHAIFVLATTEPDKLLPTIVSRCQRFDFRYVPMDEAVGYLATVAKAEKIKISPDGLEFVARQSGGGMRDAMSLLDQASFIEGEITQARLTEWLGFVDWQTVCDMTNGLAAGNVKEVLAKIDELYHNGYDLHLLDSSWIALVRQVLAVKLGNGDKLPVAKEQINRLAGLAEILSLQKIITILQELMWAGRELKTAVVPQAPLEIVVVRLAEQGNQAVVAASSQPNRSEVVQGGDTPNSEPPQPTGEIKGGNLPKAVAEDVEPAGNISNSELLEIWPRVLEQMRSFSPTLTATLAKTQIEVADGAVAIRFTSKFHKEKMEQPASMGLLKRALGEVGFNCRVVCVVEEAKVEQPVDLQNVSEVFGGLS